MSQASSYRELALHNQIIKYESELNTLKTQQNYSTGDISSVATEWIDIDSYVVNVPSIGGMPGWSVREVAATFTFTGSLTDKMAVGVIDAKPSASGATMAWQFFMPSDSPNVLKFGVVYRMGGGGKLSVRLHSNMTGEFALDRTYQAYLMP